jgi:hypothetical protein
MQVIASLIFAILLFAISAACTQGQSSSETQPVPQQQTQGITNERDYSTLINSIFTPYTDQLNLSREQQFQIVAIISGEEAVAAPGIQRLMEVDQRLAEASIAYPIDETTLQDLSSQEAQILTELIAMKIHAKARIYQTLLPAQKALVQQQIRIAGGQGNEGLTGIGFN